MYCIAFTFYNPIKVNLVISFDATVLTMWQKDQHLNGFSLYSTINYKNLIKYSEKINKRSLTNSFHPNYMRQYVYLSFLKRWMQSLAFQYQQVVANDAVARRAWVT